jgi:hypothetical protein
LGIGFGGSVNIEVGAIEMDSPQDISGWGFAGSAFAAAGHGVGLQVAGTGPYGGGEVGVAAGYAAGAGAGISGIGTYTWYNGMENILETNRGLYNRLLDLFNQSEGRMCK